MKNGADGTTLIPGIEPLFRSTANRELPTANPKKGDTTLHVPPNLHSFLVSWSLVWICRSATRGVGVVTSLNWHPALGRVRGTSLDRRESEDREAHEPDRLRRYTLSGYNQQGKLLRERLLENGSWPAGSTRHRQCRLLRVQRLDQRKPWRTWHGRQRRRS